MAIVQSVFLRLSISVLVVMAGLSLVGCRWISSERGFSGVEFTNRTDVTVDIIFKNTNDVESTLYRQLKPGTVTTVDAFTTDCSNMGTYIARDADGQEIARRFGPVCRPDTWVIEAGTATPSG